MPGRGLQGEVLVDAVGPFPEHDLSCAVDGRDAVLVDQPVVLPHAARVPVRGTEVVVVRGRDEVLGVGEGGHPTPVLRNGVPADVVAVDVGVDDDVDVLRPDSHPRQLPEEVALPLVEERRTGPLAPVAHARVDQDGLPGAAQDPGLEGQDRPVLDGLPVVRRQPVLVALPHLSPDARHQIGCGPQRPLPLDDTGDLYVTQDDALPALDLHAAKSRKSWMSPSMPARLIRIRDRLILDAAGTLARWMW